MWWVYAVDESFTTKIISVAAPVMVNTVFMAFVFHLYSKTKKRLGNFRGYIAFIFFWLTYEYIQFHWELSNPWLTLGNVFSIKAKWVQWYEFTGVFGGSLWVLIVNLLGFLLIKTMLETTKRLPWRFISLLSLVLFIPILFSYLLYHNHQESSSTATVTVVQPNIDPYNYKFSESGEKQVNIILDLAQEKPLEKTDYILGPETALPYSAWTHKINEFPLYQQVKEFNDEHPNTDIVLGASLREVYDSRINLPPTARKFKNVEKWYDSFNSAIQVDQTDSIQIYHKSKLVLGVEKMPFPQFFRHFQEAIFDLGGTTGSLGSQSSRSVFQSSNDSTVVAPVICWESVYGEFVADYVLKGANLIFILTNDGWWDNTPGHLQHLHYSRLRAIEMRKNIARSANTGISCFIDSKGNILESTKWWERNVIQKTLHTSNTITYYAENGDVIGRIATFFGVLLLIWSFTRKYMNKTTS